MFHITGGRVGLREDQESFILCNSLEGGRNRERGTDGGFVVNTRGILFWLLPFSQWNENRITGVYLCRKYMVYAILWAKASPILPWRSEFLVLGFVSSNMGKIHSNPFGPKREMTNDRTPGTIPKLKYLHFYYWNNWAFFIKIKAHASLKKKLHRLPSNTRSVFLQNTSRMELNHIVPLDGHCSVFQSPVHWLLSYHWLG